MVAAEWQRSSKIGEKFRTEHWQLNETQRVTDDNMSRMMFPAGLLAEQQEHSLSLLTKGTLHSPGFPLCSQAAPLHVDVLKALWSDSFSLCVTTHFPYMTSSAHGFK